MRDKPQDTIGAIQVQYRRRTQMGIVDVVVEWRRQCEIDLTGPRRGIVVDVAERGGGSVDCMCSEYGDLTASNRLLR